MRTSEMISTSPITVEKSVRGDEIRALTSCMAGKIVPLAYIPLLREDRVTRGSIRIGFDMSETVQKLLNSVHVSVYAHYVSPMATGRFDGMDHLNRSYQGQPNSDASVTPYIQQIPFKKNDAFWKTLGVHWPENSVINAMPVEAYNAIVNYRRRARSKLLEQRSMLDTSLAQGFWKNTDLGYVVPDFDQSMMDGEVELQFVDSRALVRGIGKGTAAETQTILTNKDVSERTDMTGGGTAKVYANAVKSDVDARLYVNTNASGVPYVFADLAESGVKLSLANIELAKQTASFAKLREQFAGLSDDYIIDLLMEGIRIPDLALRDPMLLDRASTIFGYTQRYAMDGASLDQSVTTGRTELMLNFRTPPMNTGGCILVTCEIVPEQLYERKFDHYLGILDPAAYPNFMRDYLDPEKVEVVKNGFPDVLHSQPDGIFGYAPLNHGWKRSFTRAGGKFYRPNPDSFVEDRQRFWAVDQVDPTLSDDFYLVTDPLPHTVFMDTTSDAFEVLTLGRIGIVGNTVFGDPLNEDVEAYEKVDEQVDKSRLDVDYVTPAAPAAAVATSVPAVHSDEGEN